MDIAVSMKPGFGVWINLLSMKGKDFFGSRNLYCREPHLRLCKIPYIEARYFLDACNLFNTMLVLKENSLRVNPKEAC